MQQSHWEKVINVTRMALKTYDIPMASFNLIGIEITLEEWQGQNSSQECDSFYPSSTQMSK